MDEVTQKVFEESKAFQAAIPKLKEKLAGRWVIFRDGKVEDDFATEEEAYNAAVERYGSRGGFVVDRVVDPEPVPITTRVLFGIA